MLFSTILRIEDDRLRSLVQCVALKQTNAQVIKIDSHVHCSVVPRNGLSQTYSEILWKDQCQSSKIIVKKIPCNDPKHVRKCTLQ